MFWFWPEADYSDGSYAWDSETGKVVTLEAIGRCSSENFWRRVSRVDHPNVVRVIDVSNGSVVMEQLPPTSVYDLVKHEGIRPGVKLDNKYRGVIVSPNTQISEEYSVGICRQVALGFQAITQGGINYGNFQLQDLLLNPDGVVKVKIQDCGRKRLGQSDVLNANSVLSGFPQYMAPELWRGEPANERSSIYSIGVLLYRMLTGRFPFESSFPWRLGQQHLESRHRPIRSLERDEKNWKIADVLDSCLAKDPGQRYQTFGDLAEALRVATIPDRDILVSIYKATDGPNWSNQENWLSDKPIGEWYGVTSNYAARVVTRLILANNNLSGEIPADLAELWDLEDLDLNSNDLTGKIPLELGGLSRLERLNLCGNALSGEVPVELSQLSMLQTLNLSVNRLSGQIPPELGRLTMLTGLFLGGNALRGDIPPELGQLTNLRWLLIEENVLSGQIPSELSQLTILVSLSLFGNQLSGEIPSEIGDLTRLRTFRLDSNRLTGKIPPELGRLVNLVCLRLDSNRLAGSVPPELGNLTNLNEFGLGGNQDITGCIPMRLTRIPRSDIFTLNLPECKS